MITEADTCRKYILPRLIQSGWDNEPHSFTEQKTFTDGRIVVTGEKTRRRSHLARGWTVDQILREFDHLKPEDIQACLAYASEIIKSEQIYPLSSQ